jgi:hypothetical protein
MFASRHEGREVLMGWKFRDKCVTDFPKLVDSYTKDELASPRRSTVPLLAFWAHAESRLRELAAYTALDPSEAVEFCFEFPVPVQQGKGKASFTDLMIVSSSFAVAIEGKYMEPPYETVEGWLGKPGRENREAVLAGWLSLIERATGVRLGAAQVAEYPYQLIHRTASACFPQVKARWVIYQLFSKNDHNHYRKHLSDLHHLLGMQATLSFGVLLSPLKGSAEYSKVDARWERGERDLSREVRAGLLSDTLFEFSDVQFIKVDQALAAGVTREGPRNGKIERMEVK